MEPGYLLSGRYRIADLIGRGSQSSVFRAYDELLQRDVAVKLFRNDADDLEQTRRQGEEIRILAGMSHHALVTLFDAGADLSDRNDPLTYLVMELVRGQDLRHRGAQGPLSAAHMAHIGYDLADGLSYIHHHGIVHRDVKPANILLVDYSNDDRRPRAKLTDFGVAVITRNGPVPDEGGTSGTPAYLSPEQAAGDVAGPASDVYSLGLVLLEGLTGKMAYPGAPIQSAVARLLHDPQIPEELAPMWVALLSSMLARDPAQRPRGPGSVAGPAPGSHQQRRPPPHGQRPGRQRRGRPDARRRALPDPRHPAGRRLRPDRGTRGTDVLRAGGDRQRGGP